MYRAKKCTRLRYHRAQVCAGLRYVQDSDMLIAHAYMFRAYVCTKSTDINLM